jgi:hypothetical protein
MGPHTPQVWWPLLGFGVLGVLSWGQGRKVAL